MATSHVLCCGPAPWPTLAPWPPAAAPAAQGASLLASASLKRPLWPEFRRGRGQRGFASRREAGEHRMTTAGTTPSPEQRGQPPQHRFSRRGMPAGHLGCVALVRLLSRARAVPAQPPSAVVHPGELYDTLAQQRVETDAPSAATATFALNGAVRVAMGTPLGPATGTVPAAAGEAHADAADAGSPSCGDGPGSNIDASGHVGDAGDGVGLSIGGSGASSAPGAPGTSTDGSAAIQGQWRQGASGGGSGQARLGNWRLAWWDDYEREVGASAVTAAVATVGAAGPAGEAALRPEKPDAAANASSRGVDEPASKRRRLNERERAKALAAAAAPLPPRGAVKAATATAAARRGAAKAAVAAATEDGRGRAARRAVIAAPSIAAAPAAAAASTAAAEDGAAARNSDSAAGMGGSVSLAVRPTRQGNADEISGEAHSASLGAGPTAPDVTSAADAATTAVGATSRADTTAAAAVTASEDVEAMAAVGGELPDDDDDDTAAVKAATGDNGTGLKHPSAEAEAEADAEAGAEAETAMGVEEEVEAEAGGPPDLPHGGPDLLPPFVDPDQEYGRLSPDRLGSLYYIRELVIRRVTSSADARLLVDWLDWCLPLMDLAACREGFRMIRAASVSVAFPRNPQLLVRPRFLAAFHFLARRLRGLLDEYGADVMDWPYLMAVTAGLSAGRVRDRELMQRLHDRGLELLRRSEAARAQWQAARRERKQQRAEAEVEAAASAARVKGPGPEVTPPSDAEAEAPSEAGEVAATAEAGPSGDAGADAGGRGSRRGGGRARGRSGRDSAASRALHVPAVGLRELVCRFLLPLHHLGQAIDPEFLQLLEGMLGRALAAPRPAAAAGAAAATAAESDATPPAAGWQPPPTLWLLRDTLELYGMVGAEPSPTTLAGVRDGCVAAAAELRAAAAAGAAAVTAGPPMPRPGSAPASTGGRRGSAGGAGVSWEGCREEQRGGPGVRGPKKARTWSRLPVGSPGAARTSGSGADSDGVDGTDGGGGDADRPGREYEVLAGTLASVLYLLSRIVRQRGGGVFYDGSDGDGTEAAAAGGYSPGELVWAHESLEALVPWMHTLSPLQLSGLLRTTVWLGAAQRLLTPPPTSQLTPPQLQLGQAAGQQQRQPQRGWTFGRLGGEPSRPAGGGGAAALLQRPFLQGQPAAPPLPLPSPPHLPPQLSQQQPTPFLRAYFTSLSRALSEQPAAGAWSLGNVVEAAVGIAAAGVAAGVPRPIGRDLYGKLLFRANAVMSYQASQRNGFVPPYALNLVPAVAQAVRDGGSAAAVPAKLVAANLGLGARLLAGWHADGLAQVAAAMETMSWVTPPEGWVDSLYAALAQRLHAGPAAPATSAAATAAGGTPGPPTDPRVGRDAHGAAATASDVDVAMATAAVQRQTSRLPSPAVSQHDIGTDEGADGHDGSSGSGEGFQGSVAPPARTVLLPPPPQPDRLSPASLLALLRSAKHLAAVAVASPAEPAAAPAAAALASADAASTVAAAPSPPPLPPQPCGAMPEPLAECLALRLAAMLAKGEGLYDNDLTELVALAVRRPGVRPLSPPSASPLPVASRLAASDGAAAGGNAGFGASAAGTSEEEQKPVGPAHESQPLQLLDALLAAAVEEEEEEAPSTAAAVTPSQPPREHPGSRAGAAAANVAVAEARTRGIVLSALEQALALQLRSGHPAVVTHGSVAALTASLERALGRPPGEIWRAAVAAHLEGLVDTALAEIRRRQAAAAAPLPPSALYDAAFAAVKTANEMLDFCHTDAATTADTVAVTSTAGTTLAAAARSVGGGGSTLQPGWWREVSYSAGVCVNAFRHRRAKSAAGPGRLQLRGPRPEAGPRGKTPAAAAGSADSASAVALDPGSSSPGSSTEPELAATLDELMRYAQHLGRWLAAARGSDAPPSPSAPPPTVSMTPSPMPAPSGAESVEKAETAQAPHGERPAPLHARGQQQQQQQDERRQQPQRQPQRPGLLQPHIHFLLGLFTLLQPLLLNNLNHHNHLQSPPAADAASPPRGHPGPGARAPRGEARAAARPYSATAAAAAATAAGPPAPLPAVVVGTALTALTPAQLVRLAEVLAVSRFQPLRFTALAGWPEAFLARLAAAVPHLSSTEACMAVRALSCQGWRPEPELMDALLDRVMADGGLARLRAAYGPASLVQLLSWLAFARFLPAEEWMEALLWEMVPHLALPGRAGEAPSRLAVRAVGDVDVDAAEAAAAAGATAPGCGGSSSVSGARLNSGYSGSSSSSNGASISNVDNGSGSNRCHSNGSDRMSSSSSSSGSSTTERIEYASCRSDIGGGCNSSSSSSSSGNGSLSSSSGSTGAGNTGNSFDTNTNSRMAHIANSHALNLQKEHLLHERELNTREGNRCTSTSSNPTAVAAFGLGELCVLGNSLAELRCRPPQPWLGRALAAAGAAAVAASAEAAGLVLLTPDGARAGEHRAGAATSTYGSLPPAAALQSSPPPDSSGPLASQLASLLWRWAAVASTTTMAPEGGGGAAAAAASAADVQAFAGRMAAATAPLLCRMGPADIVRCAEGMAALQQRVSRRRNGGGGGGEGGRRAAGGAATSAETPSRSAADGEAAAAAAAAAAAQRADMLARSMSLVAGGGIGELAHGGPSGGGGVGGRLDLQPWWRELERASVNSLLTRPAAAALQAPQVKPYTLSVTLRCMAAAGHVPSWSWLQRYCQHTQPLLPSYKAQDLAVSLWAFAHMCLSLGGSCRTTAAPTAAAATAPPAPALPPRASWREPTATESAAPAPPALGRWVEAAVALLQPPLLRHCSSADLQNIAWALVVLDFPPPTGWLRQYERATAPRLPYLSGAALLYSLWAYGKFGHAPTGSYMAAALEALRPGLLGPSPGTGTAPPAALLPPPAEAPGDAAARASGGNSGGGGRGVVGLLDGQSLALALHSLSQLDYLPGDAWLGEYMRAVLVALPGMSPTGLTIILRAAATMQLRPPPVWLDALVGVAAARLPVFTAQQLESLLSALCDMAAAAAPTDLPASVPRLRRFLWGCLEAHPDNRRVGAYYRILMAPHTATDGAATELVAAGPDCDEGPADTGPADTGPGAPVLQAARPPLGAAVGAPVTAAVAGAAIGSPPAAAMTAALYATPAVDPPAPAHGLQDPWVTEPLPAISTRGMEHGLAAASAPAAGAQARRGRGRLARSAGPTTAALGPPPAQVPPSLPQTGAQTGGGHGLAASLQGAVSGNQGSGSDSDTGASGAGASPGRWGPHGRAGRPRQVVRQRRGGASKTREGQVASAP